jgi:glycosyltransferase involved in cell wall biosynthesis
MINIVGPVNQLGYGITCLNILKSLSRIFPTCYFPIGNPQVTNQADADIVSDCIKNSQLLDFDAPCVKIWHQHDMTQFAGKGLRIGFPIFELDKFNKVEKHHLSSLDKIFVCSSWAKNIILNSINFNQNNVHVIPLGVDRDIFKTTPIDESETTRFYNCGKWEIRKGHDILVELFNSAFSNNDNVELYLMCDNPFCTQQETQEWTNLYKKSKLGNKIHIIPRQNTQQEVYIIMKKMHCGIFPARAEGWNLELLEMLSCGRHAITTNYSAHAEFCNPNNSYLVDIDNLEPAYDGKWFHGQGNWAKIEPKQKDCFIKHMQNFYNQHQSGNLTLNDKGVKMATKFSWDQTAREILNVVKTN